MTAVEIRHSSWIELPGVAMPAGTLIVAIGDVHGMAPQAERLLHEVEGDLASHGRGLCIWLGDYVDRGPDSLAVIDLVRRPLAAKGIDTVRLLGNHEAMMLACMEPTGSLAEAAAHWAMNGGSATLENLGLPRRAVRDKDLPARLVAALGPERLAFLRTLPRSHRIGDLLFVHAGIDPVRPLEAQDAGTLIWIRDPFLWHRKAMPENVVVVHGHTIEDAAIRVGESPWRSGGPRPTRIGIDSGCFATGILTAVEFLEGRARFVHAIGAPAF